MSRQYQPLDYRTIVITGTTGGITGGDIIPDGYVGSIKQISYSELTNTGQNVQLRQQPSGQNIDARRLAAQENWPDELDFEPEHTLGIIGQSNVLQVVTSQGNVIARVVYVIEPGRQ